MGGDGDSQTNTTFFKINKDETHKGKFIFQNNNSNECIIQTDAQAKPVDLT